jgi:hypothetical protein
LAQQLLIKKVKAIEVMKIDKKCSVMNNERTKMNKKEKHMKKMIILTVSLMIIGQVSALSLPEKNHSYYRNYREEKMIGYGYEQTFKRFEKEKFVPEQNAILSVTNMRGDISFIGWDNDYVLVKSAAYSKGRKNDLEHVSLQISSEYKIEVIAPRKSKVRVHLKIYVPHHMLIGEVGIGRRESIYKKTQFFHLR